MAAKEKASALPTERVYGRRDFMGPSAAEGNGERKGEKFSSHERSLDAEFADLRSISELLH